MNTRWRLRVSSAITRSLGQVNWVEIAALIGLGCLIALVQANLHLRLGLPGWRGVIWLLPLVATRLLTRSFGAASITSFSAAGFTFLFGVENDPINWFFYLAVGEILDLAYHLGGRRRNTIWFWTIIAGLVHLIRPAARIVINMSGIWVYGSFASGYVYPLATHFIFGIVAGLLGSATVLLARRPR